MEIEFPPIAVGDVETRGEIEERPADYAGPALSPAGLQLTPRPLGAGVWALLANPLPRDNGGVVAGRDAALVIDAGVSPSVGRQIQAEVRALTDKPLRYLVNTTYHGDHTFGNSAFPPDVRIVSSRLNALGMGDLAKEKRVRARNMYGDRSLDEVVEWRKPDITFEHFLELDLGGATVQLWQFGGGNGPGDTVVYAPGARVAWTGNFLGHRGVAPMLLEGGPRPYVASLARMKAALDVDVIVPGHGPIDREPGVIDWMIAYLEALDAEVRQAYAAGASLHDALRARRPLPAPALPHAPPEAGQMLGKLNRDMDRLNVLATWRDLERDRGRGA